jgi:hypothetical protein
MTDGETHQLHLCFGCHEARMYGPGYKLYCDVGGAAYEQFKSILTSYRKNRPLREAQWSLETPGSSVP